MDWTLSLRNLTQLRKLHERFGTYMERQCSVLVSVLVFEVGCCHGVVVVAVPMSRV